ARWSPPNTPPITQCPFNGGTETMDWQRVNIQPQPAKINNHPSNLMPRCIKKPAAVSAHPYRSIQNAGSDWSWRKSHPGQTSASSPATEPINKAGINAWATRRVGGDQNGSDSLR